MKPKEENPESFENENTDNDLQSGAPNYNFKWMVALLIVAIIGSFIFKYLTQ